MWAAVTLAALAADAPTGAIEELDLEGLLDLFGDEVDGQIEVASRSAEGEREAPAIVTLLTADDLRRAGCRDLLDALRLIPGMEFGADVWNTTGPIVRGIWGDGRVLLRVDGHEWNEVDYGSTPLGNRIPAHLIERIEVIRGPGSALYGGYAGIAVIEVTTRADGAFDGVRADGVASWLPSGVYGRQGLGASIGAPLGERGRLGVSAALGRGRRSDDDYTDVRGNTIDLTDVSATDPALVSADLETGALEVALAAERYGTTFQDGYAKVKAREHENVFGGVYGRAQLTLPLARGVGLRPRVSSKVQWPWNNHVPVPPDFSYVADRVDRTVAGVDFAVREVLPVDLLLGAEGGLDRRATWLRREGAVTPFRSFAFGAAFAQAVLPTPVADLTLGGRFDVHESYGGAVSPRLVVTNAWTRVHYKLAANRAFRAPGLVQSETAPRPEIVEAYEAELGAGPASWMYVTVGAFDTTVRDAMVYQYTVDPVTGAEFEGYANVGTVGTRGFEVEARALYGPAAGTAGYSYYTAAGRETSVPDYEVPSDPAALMGAPQHKAVARVDVDPAKGLVLGGVVTWLGSRWAITSAEGPEPSYEELDGALLLDATVAVEVPWVRGLSVQGSVHDLLDRNPPFVQPYDDLHAPTPSTGRELLLQITVEP